MTMSSSRLRTAIAFLPFGYQVETRIRDARSLGFVAVSSWLPAIWIAYRTGDFPLEQACLHFAIGYLAFVSLYELGYLANDAWDARRHRDGRSRLPFRASPLQLAVFIAIRLAVWVGIGIAMRWLGNPLWVGGFCVLAVAMATHNLLRSIPLRLASFSQLAVLRFVLPVAGILTVDGCLAAILCATLLYLPLRLLSYADSKGLLAMPQRTATWFAPCFHAIGLPLIAFSAFALDLDVIIEVALFLALAHVTWAMASHQASSAKR